MRQIVLRLKTWWMKFAYAVGWFNTRVLLSLVYFTLIAVPALVLKLMRRDLLDRKWEKSASTYWKDKEAIEHSIENARHQF
ncbi:MAG TPA: SxtJ family membrane protein [Bacteroidota bacterium]|nr:SxtJ family membrane protein [Bacteroidota bacterium]